MDMRVAGIGSHRSKIIVVGDFPVGEDLAKGIPFASGYGRLLDSMLSSCGIQRHECYFTNLMKYRPANGDMGTLYADPKKQNEPLPQLQAAWQELLTELGSLEDPYLIIALGDEALRALTGKRNLGKWRGSIQQISLPHGTGLRQVKLIATYHPSYVMKVYSDRAIAEMDFRRCCEEAKAKDFRLPSPTIHINSSFDHVMSFLRRIQPGTIITEDIETVGNHISCIGIGVSEDEAMSIPLQSHANSHLNLDGVTNLTSIMAGVGAVGLTAHWPIEQERTILDELWRINSDPTIYKVLQNCPFDTLVLGHEYGILVRGIIMDTMVAAHTCYCELPKGLDFLASIYTRIPYYSDYNPSSDHELWTYNGWDCISTYAVYHALVRELKDLGQEAFYFNHIHPAVLAYARIDCRGVLMDRVKMQQLGDKCEQELTEIVDKIRKQAGNPEFNPGSPQQMQKLLYETLRLPIQWKRDPKTKIERPTTDKFAIRSLKEKCPQYEQLLTLIQEESRKSTLLGFFRKEYDIDSRIRTHFNVAGTDTGRLASSEPPIIFRGTNLQNIPNRTEEGRQIRDCFIADDGWTILKADLSQAEFRAVAWYAKVRRVIEEYARNPEWDCHKWVASLIYKKPESQVEKAERSLAKNGVYGGNYDMHYTKAAQVYELKPAMAKWVLDEYRKALPEIPMWWTEVQTALRSTHCTRNAAGRLRYFFGRVDDEMFRAAYSHQCQSLVADIVLDATTELEFSTDPDEFQLLLQVHDELVAKCRVEHLDKYAGLLKKAMEQPIQFVGIPEPLLIPADVSYGPTWMNTKKWKGAVA